MIIWWNCSTRYLLFYQL